MDQLITSTNSLRAGLGGLSAPIAQGASAMRQLISSSSGAKAAMDGLKGTLSTLAAGVSPLANAFKSASTAVTTGVSGMTNSFRTILPTMELFTAEGKKMVVTNEQIATSNATTAATFQRLQQGYQQASTGATQYVSSSQRVAATNQQIAGSQDQLNTSMGLSRGAMKAGAQEMTNYISRAAGMFISVVGLSQAVQESVGMQEALAEQQAKVADSEESFTAIKGCRSSGNQRIY